MTESTEIGAFLKICGGAILVAVISLIMAEISKGMRLPIRSLGTVVLYGAVLLLMTAPLRRLGVFLSAYHLSEYGELILKCLGIGLLSEITSDLCRDMGEGSLGGIVELCGKLVILTMALPIVEKLLSVAAELV